MQHINSFCFILIIVFLANFASAQPPKVAKQYIGADSLNHVSGPIPYQVQKKYKKVKTTSTYLTMRDGVKIAVNVTLPKGMKNEETVPAIMYQTRYWRGAKFRWPFSMFVNNYSGNAGKMMKEVIRTGYALISVDARGSGASFGSRKHPWTEEEVKDGYEIVDWVIKQPWCNGKVGSSGISYSGTTAEFLATTMHPAVKAIMPMFSLYDVYDDISLPGGIQLEYFTKNWGIANYKLDNNKLPIKNGLAKLAVKGVQPVKGQKKLLKGAIYEHRNNLNVNDGVKSLVYRDDISQIDNKTGPDAFSPHTFSWKIDSAKVAVYSVSGYFDGNYQHAAVKRFLSLKNSENKLLLGPWEHGGWMNCSWHNPGKSSFSKTQEALKFFDYYLKGIETGITKEPRIHYYTMGEEKWKSSDVWPPLNTYYRKIFLGEGNKLLIFPPNENNYSFTSYSIDTSFGSGTYSRWRSLMSQLKVPFPYFDWTERSKNLLHFSTEPLRENTEITGHPVVTIYINSSAADGIFIAYLEDIDENGNVHYVTEGGIRGLHRKISSNPRPHNDVEQIPFHSYLRADGQQMNPSGIDTLSFDLLPVSYLFKKGHTIRLSFSGADRDHFPLIVPASDWRIMHNSINASYIELPLVK
jgi:uncharacterized protein